VESPSREKGTQLAFDCESRSEFLRSLEQKRRGKLAAFGWRRGAVVSGVRRMNEVNARRARLVPGMGDRLRAGIPPRCVTNQLGQLSLASLWGRLIEYQLRLG